MFSSKTGKGNVQSTFPFPLSKEQSLFYRVILENLCHWPGKCSKAKLRRGVWKSGKSLGKKGWAIE